MRLLGLVELLFTSGRSLWMRGLRPLSCDVRAWRVIRLIHSQPHLDAYGSPRMARELSKLGVRCSENTVAKVMRQAGIRAVGAKKFRVSTTDSKHDLPIAENLLKQDFSVTANQQRLAYGFHVHSSLRRLYVPLRCRGPLLAFVSLAGQPANRSIPSWPWPR